MQTIDTFSGEVTVATKALKVDFSTLEPGKVYVANQGSEYSTAKGFIVALSRYANSNSLTVERLVSPDGTKVEFRLTPQ